MGKGRKKGKGKYSITVGSCLAVRGGRGDCAKSISTELDDRLHKVRTWPKPTASREFLPLRAHELLGSD